MKTASNFKLPEDDQSVQMMLMKISHTQFNQIYQMLSDRHVHPGQVRLLKFIKDNDGVKQSEISKQLQISPPTVTVSIKRMLAAGLLERKADEGNQRASRIYLTEKGQQLSHETTALMAHQEEVMLKNFTDSEKCLLKRFLTQIYENMEHIIIKKG